MASLALLAVCLVAATVRADTIKPGCPEKLERYLKGFGYLNPMRNCTTEDLGAALRKFQEMNINFNGLQVTGECDNITRRVLEMPRCGCEDIVKGETKMMPPEEFRLGPQDFRTFPTKWSKRDLTWKVLQYPRRNNHLTNGQVDDAMQRALNIWAEKTSMTFRKHTGTTKADINIRFLTRRHTSSPPYYDFDGKGNVLAHAFSPESGVVHFDDDEEFTLGNDRGTELFIVAAHEFGHTLGISHSNQQEALMAPYYRYSTSLQLHSDDIQAIQSLYGRPTNVPTTAVQSTPAPTRPPPPTRAPVLPDYCNIRISASFRIDSTTYIFSRERVSSMRTKTFVYKVSDNTGIDQSSRTPIENMFMKESGSRYPRAYPYRVDAAAYIPHKRFIFLFSGTRSYRYHQNTRDVFYLDTDEGYPRWMDVSEFPERPRAAVAMPYYNHNAYYMLIFGTTMVWDWNFFSERVGAWAYPIEVFGRSMPLQMNGAYLQDRQNAIFFKRDKFYKFSISQRRVLDDDESVKDIKKDFFKKGCM